MTSYTSHNNYYPSRDISTWSIDETMNWLRSIKLPQYIETFYENHVNGYDLCLLGDQELKSELNVQRLHDRNIMLKSIREYSLSQLRLYIKYGNKVFELQLDLERTLTLEKILPYIKDVIKISDNAEKCLIYNESRELLNLNCRIVELILINPEKYKTIMITSYASPIVKESRSDDSGRGGVKDFSEREDSRFRNGVDIRVNNSSSDYSRHGRYLSEVSNKEENSNAKELNSNSHYVRPKPERPDKKDNSRERINSRNPSAKDFNKPPADEIMREKKSKTRRSPITEARERKSELVESGERSRSRERLNSRSASKENIVRRENEKERGDNSLSLSSNEMPNQNLGQSKSYKNLPMPLSEDRGDRSKLNSLTIQTDRDRILQYKVERNQNQFNQTTRANGYEIRDRTTFEELYGQDAKAPNLNFNRQHPSSSTSTNEISLKDSQKSFHSTGKPKEREEASKARTIREIDDKINRARENDRSQRAVSKR